MTPADAGTQTTPDTGVEGPADGGMAHLGNGSVSSAEAVATTGPAFWSPFDSTPSPDGTQIYFIASGGVDKLNEGTGVFKVPAAGGSVTKVFVGAPFSALTSLTISSDGNTLYVVDRGAEDATGHPGRIFSLSSAGGTPSAITGADGTSPVGIDLVQQGGTDILFFTGKDASDHDKPAIFKMGATGGTPTVVVKGARLRQPNSLAVTKTGVIYLTDSAAYQARRTGGVLKVENGTATGFADDLRLGFPAGIAMVQDESAILVSAINPMTGGSIVYRYDLATKARTDFSTGISQNTESGGVHRAHGADVYSWANASGCRRCAPDQGGVYLVR
jgi:sugar lactone lactonase YvrE